MSITTDLLIFLSGKPGVYKVLRKQLYGIPYRASKSVKYFQDIPDKNFRSRLSTLKGKGLIRNKAGIWEVTKKGLDFIKSNHGEAYVKNEKNNKNLVIIFDVPEKFHAKRDWLRRELIFLGFEKIQQSVWLGPAPLPEEFIVALKDMRLFNYINFFEAKKAEII